MRTIYLSKNANCRLIKYLKNKNLSVKIIDGDKRITTGISSHPDIYMCKLGIDYSAPVFSGNPDKLGEKYPMDIRYNAACTGKYFIHNLKYTDEELLSEASDRGLTLINTRQGYTKCSLAIIDENSVITSDEGSAKALKKSGLDVLLIHPGHIRLQGYDCGFIGGTCGRIENEIIFNGNLAAHPDFNRINNFITEKGLIIKYFEEYTLEDIGSIIYGDIIKPISHCNTTTQKDKL